MITRKTISEQVFDHIIDEIRIGKLAPGDQLKDERGLAEELGVSRVPLREAIKSLTQIGVLISRHGEGTFVNTNSADVMTNAMNLYVAMEDSLVLEFAEVRRLMEKEAARLASQNATEEEIKEMMDLCAERERIAQEEKNPDLLREKLNEHDTNFHMAIAKATHNSVFYNFLDSMRSNLHLHQEEAAHQPNMLNKANTAHKKVVKAITARDADGAAKAMEYHIMEVEEALLNELGND